jgi:hypothetical protein
MPKVKTDIAGLARREAELREELRALRAQQRAAERAAAEARSRVVAELASAAGIAGLPRAVLEREFARIARENPAPVTPARPADDTAAAGDEGAQTPALDAQETATERAPVAEGDMAADAGGKRRWF